MEARSADPTLDRLLRHMAWANAALLGRLAALPDPAHALSLAAPRNEWSAARIVAHLVDAAAGYACRLDGGTRPPSSAVPTTTAELVALADACASYDARLRVAAAEPEGTVQTTSGVRARSTILGQAIHHATEHRAQIAGALATNGIDAIDLDELDLWAYGDAEGLGA